MTRKEAIERIKDHMVIHKMNESRAIHISEALNMAIEALEQEPCEDVISRQAVIDGINEYFHDEYYQRTSIQDCRDCLIEDVIKPLSPAQPQPKMGHWISIEERTDWYDATYECSCCGRQIITPYELIKNLYEQYPYCHCGAKMVKPQESEKEE